MRRVALAVVPLACAAALFGTAGEAAAAGVCARWAATEGSDGSVSGSQAAPYRSLGKLVASLDPGQTGCLPAGETYFSVAGNGNIDLGGTAAAPVTISSGPGGRAAVKGILHLKPTSHDITLEGLDLQGGLDNDPLYEKGTHLVVHGDRIGIVDNDIANPQGICVSGGKAHATNPAINDVATDLRITGNRIHDCGMDPTLVWTDGDSGAHGVYFENTAGARVTDNLFYRNRWRGLQLWPRSDRAVIERNVFDENATHVNIGSSYRPELETGFFTTKTIVRDNIFTGRVTDFRPSKNPSQVFGNFPPGSPTHGNEVYDNCFAPGDATGTGYGYTLGPNTTAQALFADRAARDYRLVAGSPCIGKGPASIQPGIDRFVTVTAPAEAATGDAVDAAVTVQNRTDEPGPVSVTLALGAAKRLGLKPSLGSCSGTTCTATLPGDGTLTIAVRIGILRAPGATVGATLGEADATPEDDRASASIAVAGPRCTRAGTDAADMLRGTSTGEVFCLFGGNDTVMPDGGNDIVIGGAGRDRLSYWDAANAVVLDLRDRVASDARTGTTIGRDTFSGIEWGTGTAHADTLLGSDGADTLDGLEGGDSIAGRGGNDQLKGWSGDDRLYGAGGDDDLDGGVGSDLCDEGVGVGTKRACER